MLLLLCVRPLQGPWRITSREWRPWQGQLVYDEPTMERMFNSGGLHLHRNVRNALSQNHSFEPRLAFGVAAHQQNDSLDDEEEQAAGSDDDGADSMICGEVGCTKPMEVHTEGASCDECCELVDCGRKMWGCADCDYDVCYDRTLCASRKQRAIRSARRLRQ